MTLTCLGRDDLRRNVKSIKRGKTPLHILKMTCANVMSRLGSSSMSVSVMSVDMAMGFRCRSSPHIHRIGVSSPKPLRPCITHHPAFEHQRSASPARLAAGGRRDKRVAFADSRGLSLITVRLYSEREEKSPRPKRLNRIQESASKTLGLRLGFEQPCVDFQAFRCRLQENMVLLESCKATERAVLGTVRVLNVGYEKTVRVRITFDSWRSYLDAPCAYLDQCYGEPGTDVFEFNIAVPERTDPGERIEFCVSYLPAGFSAAKWDNNYGRNYCIHVCDA